MLNRIQINKSVLVSVQLYLPALANVVAFKSPVIFLRENKVDKILISQTKQG